MRIDSIKTDSLKSVLISMGVVVGSVGVLAALALTAVYEGVAPAASFLVVILVFTFFVARRLDAVDLLIMAILVVLLVPARYRIEPLGAAGTPAALMGLGTFAVWAFGVVFNRSWLAPKRHPMRWALTAVVLSVLLSCVALAFRPHDAVEASAADRGLMTTVSVLGFVLLTADAVRDRATLRRVVSAVVGAGAVVAGLGVLQFGTGIDLAAVFHLPGFTYVPSGYADERAGFVRIVSTTSHPIELSVVLVLLIPFAVWIAFSSVGRERKIWWACAGTIVAAVPLTVSRTGIVALLVAVCILLPGWSWRRRIQVMVVGAAGLVAMRFAVPGLLGTLQSFLFNPGGDPSLESREIGQQTAFSYIAERPLLGRGFGTFIPQRYTFFDNQVLLSLVETGIVGLAAWLGVFVIAAGLAVGARRRARGATMDEDRELALALLACVAVGSLTWLTFDALGFSTSRSLTMLAVGLAAALWRIIRDEADVRANVSPDDATELIVMPRSTKDSDRRIARAHPAGRSGLTTATKGHLRDRPGRRTT